MKIYNHYCSDAKSKTLQPGVVNYDNEVEKTIINLKTPYKTQPNIHEHTARWKTRQRLMSCNRKKKIRKSFQSFRTYKSANMQRESTGIRMRTNDGMRNPRGWWVELKLKLTDSEWDEILYLSVIQSKRKLAWISMQREGVAVAYGSVWRARRWVMRVCSIPLGMET